MEGEHVDVIATPGEDLAVGGKDKAGEVIHGTGGSMLAGNPLRIVERERTRLYGDNEMRVQNLPGCIGQIDQDLRGWHLRGWRALSCNRRNKKKGQKERLQLLMIEARSEGRTRRPAQTRSPSFKRLNLN